MSFFGRVVVYVGVVPSIGNVAARVVENDQAVFVKETQCLGWVAVVFVNFWQAVWKVKWRFEEVKRRGQWDEFFVGECAFEFPAKGFVQAVVVVGKEKSAAFEIEAQAAQFLFGESDVAVSCEKEHGIGKEVFVGERDLGFLLGGADGRVLSDKCEQVGDFRWPIVPIAAAVVFETRDGECRRRLLQLRQAGRRDDQE